ncbi:sulfotransferase family 2 domain-containing protein [Octadecabacter sp. G9-8]|uniref:Sulfotransferase family 2 domain-containing protein n=1 Tax=Octadecabacter dasysiphoniae TaxID=2909341 RepID=A0ABS9CWJ2_9RHOB|nr:sulfotransferase family 2 domain-containing protein [Octadecabacter dasysiphoniae]MCF2870526.1 sulfotransferase family 2 domain-containing protein [Octadecabacter dasysiphoniae]
MLVFAKEKLVFLALPKTGTTALETTLEPAAAMVLRKAPNLKHTPGFRYDAFLKTYLGKCGLTNLQTICVLRHPVDWLGSWYRYRARPAKDGAANSTKDMTFEDFVSEYASDDPAKWARVGYPPRFIRTNDGDVMIDHLFQYEQMPLLIAFLEDRLKMKIDLPQRNVSPPSDMTLSAQTLAKLETKHPQMFEDWENAHR